MKLIKILTYAIVLTFAMARNASAADLTGRVTVAGASGKEDVVVWIDGPMPAAPSPKNGVITQTGIRFSPAFLVVVAGQTIEMPNDDNVTHNVYSTSPAKRFNLGVYEKGQSRSVTFEKPGFVDVKCWLHKRMNATILVVPNRFYARVSAGQYRISGLPPGTYRVVATMPGAPPAAKSVVVTKSGAVNLDFTL
jgi:plastocyanin